MNLHNKILSAEQQFRKPLEEFFISVYDENRLYSHGLDHHRRVWNYAKELLLTVDNDNITGSPYFTQKLIIACYIHDIGMAVDPGIKHGHHSRELCSRFLKNNHLKEADFRDVLVAIENHDNKEYTGSDIKDDLLTILSVADDLDAFGYIGIYRYLEIYLARGVDPADLGNQILINAEKRYDNFASAFSNPEDLVNRHKTRYIILKDFFRNYADQAGSYQFRSLNPSGYCGVSDIIVTLKNGKSELMNYFSEMKQNPGDPVITEFFAGLIHELS